MSLRLRLTLLYGACFLAAGAALLGITYGLFAGSQSRLQSVELHGQVKLPSGAAATAFAISSNAGGSGPVSAAAGAGPVQIGGAAAGKPGAVIVRTTTTGAGVTPGVIARITKLSRSDQKDAQRQLSALVRRANLIIRTQHTNSMSSLLVWSGVGLGVMTLLSVLLGWLVAGRALTPLRTMNLRAREITAENLHARLGVAGRRDELGDLAGTFDELLGRLEGSFEAQRRFIQNASHELRTPLTLERALVEVALADPHASVESLQLVCRRVLAASESQERLIDALLALARGQAGIGAVTPVALDELVAGVLEQRAAGLVGLTLDAELGPATAAGDPALLERLAANLVDNAINHNVADGWIRLRTGQNASGAPFITITNSGPQLAEGEIQSLAEPFRRGPGERIGPGVGLGLSIVQAIATAHGATLTMTPEPGGGLAVTVSLLPFRADDGSPEKAPRPEAFPVLRPGI